MNSGEKNPGDLGPGGGDLSPGEDFGGLLGAMGEFQQRLARAEQDANSRPVRGTSAQGLVTVEVSGEFSFDKVSIDPSVVDSTDIGLLEDLVLAALRDAATKLKTMRTQAMGGAVTEMLGNLFGTDEPGPKG